MRVRFLFVVAVACVVIALLSRHKDRDAVPRSSAPARSGEIAPISSTPAPQPILHADPAMPFDEPAPTTPPPLALDRGAPEWEARIALVTRNGALDDAGKAKALLAMLDSLPPEALDDAAREAGERLPDSAYASASVRLLNPQTHGRVLGVLFADLLERPDAIALPTLLAIAENPAHPFSAQARENLELLLRKNYGADWPRWDAAVHEALK